MAEQITKKQHFAPSFYFKRFSDNDWIQVLEFQKGLILKPRPYTSVCYGLFYYAQTTGKADEASQEYETFFKSIEDYFSADFDNIIEAILKYQQLTPQQLDRLAWFFACLWVRSPQMRKQLNNMMEDVMKWFSGITASHPSFRENSRKALEERGFAVTEEMLESAEKTFTSGDFDLEFDNVSHLQFITKCEEYKRWFHTKNWRFYIARGSKRFTTSDTPVLDIFKGETLQERMYSNHIMARQQFLALTPDILIELTDPRFGKKVKRKAIDDDEVVQYNLLRARYSEEYSYSKAKTDLEDLLEYYEG